MLRNTCNKDDPVLWHIPGFLNSMWIKFGQTYMLIFGWCSIMRWRDDITMQLLFALFCNDTGFLALFNKETILFSNDFLPHTYKCSQQDMSSSFKRKIETTEHSWYDMSCSDLTANHLTHLGMEKMIDIADDCLSNIFLKENFFHLIEASLTYFKSPIAISQHWFRSCPGSKQAASHYLEWR